MATLNLPNIENGKITQGPTKKLSFRDKYFQEHNTSFVCLLPLIFFALLSCYADVRGMNFALPIMAKEFDQPPSMVQWALNIYFLATAVVSVPFAKLAEIIGWVFALYIYIGGLTICSVIIYFITNFYAFCAVHFVMGACFGGICVITYSMLRRMAPPIKAQPYMIYTAAILNILNALVPLVYGFIVDINWRLLFVICAGSGLLAIISLIPFRNPKKEPKQQGAKFDIWGTLLILISIALINLCFTFLTGKAYVIAAVLFVASIGGFIGFVFVELKIKFPIFPIQLMKNPVGDQSLIFFLYQIIVNGQLYLIPQIVKAYGRSSQLAGNVTSLMGLILIVVALSTPLLVRKIVNKVILTACYIITTLLFIVAGFSCFNLDFYLVVTMVFGVIYSYPNYMMQPIICTAVPLKYASLIAAVPTLCITLGGSLTLSITSMILSFGQTKGETVQDWSYRLLYVWIFYFVLHLICFVILLLRTGHAPTESNKKFFNIDKVRQLVIDDDKPKVVLSEKSTVEEHHSLLVNTEESDDKKDKGAVAACVTAMQKDINLMK